MSTLLNRFQQFYGDATKQIGKNFCIPASLCNALRILGVDVVTQERIRDEWYGEQGREIEADLDDQMDGVGIDIFETLERRTKFIERIDNEFFSRPKDENPFDLRQAENAVAFIEKHISEGHPVIASTWNRVLLEDHIEIQGYHMWLVLDFNRAGNTATFHDSGDDNV